MDGTDSTEKGNPKRDWYDRAELVFQITVTAIGALFTLITYLQGEHAAAQRDRETTAEQQNATAQRTAEFSENKRASAVGFVFQAADHSVSTNPDERNRGLALLSLLGNKSTTNALGLTGSNAQYVLAVISAAQQQSLNSLASVKSGAPSSSAAPSSVRNVPVGNCADWLREAGSPIASGAQARECWVYVGAYVGNFDSKRCAGPGSWTSQYLQFVSSVCPLDLVGKTFPVNAPTGAVYVRSAPAGQLGVAPVVGQLYPGQKVRLTLLQPSYNGPNYLWGRIGAVSK